METKVLYGLDKGNNYKVWSIQTRTYIDPITDLPQTVIEIFHGKEGGKMQKKVDFIEGKNHGRANETAPSEQAELEAMSRWRKQVDKGYRETKEELDNLEIAVMLAHDYLKQGHRIEYPCYTSAKLDGVRCLAIRTESGIKLKSRGGKLYSVKHVEDYLLEVMKHGDIWDGELYIHGKYLEEIVSAVKKPNANTPLLKFIIFDVVTEDGYSNRLIEMQRIRRYVLDEDSPVSVLSWKECSSEEEMKEQHKQFVSEGFEGVMIRNWEGKYESGKRSADLQKYKQFYDEEFLITGVQEDKNGNGVFELWDFAANAAFTTTYGDFPERKNQLAHPEQYIGKALTVKYQSRYLDTNLPQFPTGIAIRDGVWQDGVFYPAE